MSSSSKAHVLTASGFVERDVVIDGIDAVAAGAVSIVPGFVDLTARIALRGRPDEEQPRAAFLAARRAGFTALVLGDRRLEDDREGDPADVVTALAAQLREVGGPRAKLLAPLTKNGAGSEPGDVHRAVAAGADVFGDVLAHDDSEVLRRSFELAASVSRPVIVPSFDARLSRRAIAVEGPVATRLGLPAFPVGAAERIGVFRSIELARLTGVRLHISGISTARGLQLVEAARADGVDVSADVRPWSVLLDDEAWHRRPYDTVLRVWPPLPRPADTEALADAVVRGVVAIGIGHGPVPSRLKALELDVAAAGADMYSDAVGALLGRFDVAVVSRALSATPARFGFGGSPIVDDSSDAVVVRAVDGVVSSGIFAGLRRGGDVAAVVAGATLFRSEVK
ncbi:MAG TPA: hypothetical protein VGF99_14725 [Myxococcota bacterium]